MLREPPGLCQAMFLSLMLICHPCFPTAPARSILTLFPGFHVRRRGPSHQVSPVTLMRPRLSIPRPGPSIIRRSAQDVAMDSPGIGANWCAPSAATT